jgi:hypothetical protein
MVKKAKAQVTEHCNLEDIKNDINELQLDIQDIFEDLESIPCSGPSYEEMEQHFVTKKELFLFGRIVQGNFDAIDDAHKSLVGSIDNLVHAFNRISTKVTALEQRFNGLVDGSFIKRC